MTPVHLPQRRINKRIQAKKLYLGGFHIHNPMGITLQAQRGALLVLTYPFIRQSLQPSQHDCESSGAIY